MGWEAGLCLGLEDKPSCWSLNLFISIPGREDPYSMDSARGHCLPHFLLSQ